MEQRLLELKLDWEKIHTADVYEQYNACLYHYTTLENVWNILESDTMYARHVRFSNDSAEYALGKTYIQELLNKEIRNVEDCYMICFCQHENILSQWREYARGGVSLEFDLRNIDYYTIKCNERTKEINKKNGVGKDEQEYYIPSGVFWGEQDYSYAYAKPIMVKYVSKKEDLKEDFEKISKEIKNNSEMMIDAGLRTLMPYIKHSGFDEEKEVRLVFTPEKHLANYQVDYLIDKGFQKPYIKVQMGAISDKNPYVCEIKYCGLPSSLLNELNDEIIPKARKVFENPPLSVKIKESKELDAETIVLSNCKRQDKLFELITHYVQHYNYKNKTDIKIWCEGHLPIRRIIVGPAQNRDEIKESIEQKIKSMYWMEYVEVVTSDIPYRQK